MQHYQAVRAITKSDTVALAAIDVGPNSTSSIYPRAFLVGTSGDVALKTPFDTDAVVVPSVAAGVVIPLEGITYIMATGTTASDIVVFYG